MADLRELLDLVDVAIARSEGVLDEEQRRDIAGVARRARRRSGFLGEILVVALAGGTGSGKSSLLNALVSCDVVDVGVVRPTTRHAVAVTPQNASVDLGTVIDDLSVGDVLTSASLRTTVLVDLPDFDSIEAAHRNIVEEVLPTVDAVVWVVDPEKYADPVIHAEFLVPLTRYGDQFIFALNHSDRLSGSVRTVTDHLVSLLRADGYPDPEVVATAGSAPVDIDDLEEAIARRFDAKVTALTKLAVDLRSIANDAWQSCRSRTESPDRDVNAHVARVAATFVSLGVEAYDFQSSIRKR
ncbi:MAG: 50S ribosome-binding GTPase [Actinomycetia bacterium]|nr:50S ribosome-binding GTPase [Actinomycetes bacterium]